VRVKGNPLRAAWSMGRNLVDFVACVLAGNPPLLSVIIMSAAVGFLLDRLPVRPAVTSLRLE